MWTSIALFAFVVIVFIVYTKCQKKVGSLEKENRRKDADIEQLEKFIKAANGPSVNRPMSDLRKLHGEDK